jgi:hypothetical protein
MRENIVVATLDDAALCVIEWRENLVDLGGCAMKTVHQICGTGRGQFGTPQNRANNAAPDGLGGPAMVG